MVCASVNSEQIINRIPVINKADFFPSQSFSGKYFKSRTGLSPKEFRRGNQGIS
jgi:hypothetical protein